MKFIAERPERVNNPHRSSGVIKVCSPFRKMATGDCEPGQSACGKAVATRKEGLPLPLCDAASSCEPGFPRLDIGSNFRPGVSSCLLVEKGSAVKKRESPRSCLFRGAKNPKRCLCRRIRGIVGCNRLAPAWPKGGNKSQENHTADRLQANATNWLPAELRSVIPYYGEGRDTHNPLNLKVIRRHRGPKTGGWVDRRTQESY